MARLQPWYPLISFSDCMHAAAEPRFVWLFKDGSCAVRSVAMLGLCFFLHEQLCKLGGAAGLAYIQLRGHMIRHFNRTHIDYQAFLFLS